MVVAKTFEEKTLLLARAFDDPIDQGHSMTSGVSSSKFHSMRAYLTHATVS